MATSGQAKNGHNNRGPALNGVFLAKNPNSFTKVATLILLPVDILSGVCCTIIIIIITTYQHQNYYCALLICIYIIC